VAPLAVLGAASLAAALRGLKRVEVTGTSMAPGLLPGDRLVAVRGLPVRVGDVVTLADPRDGRRLLVKRVAWRSPTAVGVVGDTPEASTDSRHFGPVPRRHLRGRVVYRYAPPDRAGRMER